jgi:competence protein ComEA
MNPFIHSTVATPADTSVCQVHPFGVRVSPSTRKRLAQLVLGAACLANAAWAQAVDVNSAQVSDLQKVQGIGPKTAQLIFDERQRGGPYESLDDLSDRVKGIGPKKAARLGSAGLTVGVTAPVGPQVSATAGDVAQDKGESPPPTRFSGFFAR